MDFDLSDDEESLKSVKIERSFINKHKTNKAFINALYNYMFKNGMVEKTDVYKDILMGVYTYLVKNGDIEISDQEVIKNFPENELPF